MNLPTSDAERIKEHVKEIWLPMQWLQGSILGCLVA